MRIINLIENTNGENNCAAAHGLSFYVETRNHKVLADLGPDGQTLENAGILGIDLKEVDTVVLSHGHYDHSGGILPFTVINNKALIYMQESASGNYYADDGEEAQEKRFRYIGIDKEICNLSQLRPVCGDYVIDDGMELFTVKRKKYEIPFTNRRLLIGNKTGFIRDNFQHEQYLVITDDGKRILISGCAHNGILNILDAYKEKYGSVPDAVISGFHLMVKREYKCAELEEVRFIAEELKKYPTMFFTCHCTGIPAYDEMKKIMGDRLRYVHSGDEIRFPFT